MANMSYCRFQNTSADISDCIDSLNENNWDLELLLEKASSEHEIEGIYDFIKLCKHVAENFDDDCI